MTITNYGLWADEKPEVEEKPDPVVVMGLINGLSISEKLSYASSAFKRMLEASKKGEMAFLEIDSLPTAYIDCMVYDELVCLPNHKNDKHRTRPKSYSGKPRKW